MHTWLLGLIATGPMSTNAPASITVPPGAHQVERLDQACRRAGAVDDDVGAEPGRGGRAPRSSRSPAVVAEASSSRSAPNARACSSRSASTSTAISRPAPSISALARCISPSGPTPSTATVSPKPKPPPGPQRARPVEPVRDREQLGQRRQLRGQLVGHPEEARARQQVHQLRPAAEQVRRVGAGERVAVVLERGAQVVRIALAEAEPAPAAGQVRRRHDPVADRERPAVGVDRRLARPDRLDHAHVLVAADERVGGLALVVGAGVLEALAPPGVLVGAADAREVHRAARPRRAPGRARGSTRPRSGPGRA